MKRRYKRWLTWLGLIISAIFLYLAFRGINYRELWLTLQQINLWWLLPGIALYFLAVLVRSLRWQFLLTPIKKISIGTLFPIISIGYMGNNVFPLRMGEVLATVVLKRRENVSISGSLATIIVERIFDAVVVVGFVLLNLGQLTGFPGTGAFSQLGDLATWAAVIFVVGLGVFIAVAMFPKPAMRFIHGVIYRVLPGSLRDLVVNISDRFLEGLIRLRSPKDAVMIFVMTTLIWTLETGLYWSVDRALGLGLTFSQLKPLLLDQTFLAGLGNIYTDEALHRAKLHPMQISDTLDFHEAEHLWESIRQVLTEGIRRSGSSIDWVYRGGDFQNYFRAYHRSGEPCPDCGVPIQRITVGQRGTHICPQCQRLEE